MKTLTFLLLLFSLGASAQSDSTEHSDTVAAWVFVSPVVRDTTKPWTLTGVKGFAILVTKLDSTNACEGPRMETTDKQVYLDDKLRPITSSYVVKYVEARK